MGSRVYKNIIFVLTNKNKRSYIHCGKHNRAHIIFFFDCRRFFFNIVFFIFAVSVVLILSLSTKMFIHCFACLLFKQNIVYISTKY